MFGKVESKRILVRKVWDHAIDLREEFKASKTRVYSLSRNKRDKVQKFVDEHLKKGYIRPSKSEQTSPVFFIGKKNGEKHMVMDYRKLNRQTVKNNYPLPLITELVNNMRSKQVFTKMDLRWGYNNVCIKKEDKWKAAFTKDEKWKWGEEQQTAFKQLKAIFTTRPVLAAPELDKKFRVEADASNFMTGGVLPIKYDDNLW